MPQNPARQPEEKVLCDEPYVCRPKQIYQSLVLELTHDHQVPDPLCKACYAIFTHPFRFSPCDDNCIILEATPETTSTCRLCRLLRNRFQRRFAGASSLEVEYVVDMRENHLSAHDIIFRLVGTKFWESGVVRLALQPMGWTGRL